eukprot:gene7806-1003_t
MLILPFYSAGVGVRRFQIQQQAVPKDDMLSAIEALMNEQGFPKEYMPLFVEALMTEQGGSDIDMPEEIAAMANMLKVAEAAKKRVTRGPLPVMEGTLPDSERLLLGHHFYAAQAGTCEKTRENGMGVSSFSTFAPPITHGVAPRTFAALEPIVLAEAVRQVNMIHSGRVMFLTTVEEAYRTVATSLLVKDTEGNMMVLHLYNYVPAEMSPRKMIPAGTHIALVEPYLRFPRDDESHPVTLRCDNPQAVHVLSKRRYEQCTVKSDFEWSEEQEVVQVSAAAAAKLHKQGKLAFASGRVLEATSLYNKALRTAPPTDPTRAHLLNDRAQCHVRKGRWADALTDCKEVLGMDPTYTQSAYYKALSLLMLQRPLEAREAAADPLLNGMATSGKTAVAAYVSALCADIERAVLEQESGAYDLQALLKESGVGAESPGCVSRRHCDYESPHIKIVEGSSGKGRCMVAEKAIPAGTLLMAAKAFVFEPVDGARELDTIVGHTHMEVGSSARILPRVVQAILDRPESSTELYSLSAGPAFDDQPLPGYTGAVDVPRIRGILHNNWFSSVSENVLMQLIKEHRWMEKSGRLLSPSKRKDGLKDLRQSWESKNGVGLWIRPSLFNHSCLPNSIYFSVGDVMFISTVRDVEAGEELSIPYLDPMMPFEKRTKTLAGWNSGNGFECDCVRCEASRRHPEIGTLESEVRAMAKHVSQLSAAMPMHEAIVQSQFTRLSLAPLKCFPDREVCGALLPKFGLEAMALEAYGQPDKAISIYQRALHIHASVFGTFGSASYVIYSLCLANVAVAVGNQSVAQQSILAAFKLACLPGWHGLPISVPDFQLLVKAHSNVAPEDERSSTYLPCIQLVAHADAATGHIASQE